ncbi:recombinase family protein [Lentzea sp. BCCO 10_0798]|uniref:Recombinase family protein n=1 Tax=Lentzea kristufekii TaxID=3095430 RepID=A0ABU4THW4_9PSEU|nr:recombinase family protein [Lentzea sp. BCCO 10_0798]MDX8047859.1 recombinase family protein [Lentzea sp. BCCO 10_0798]
MVRAIVGSRVSVMTLGKTSPQEQQATGQRYVQQQDWDLVGSFEDLDVSAITFGPWQRPDLAPWLTDKVHEWDAIVFTKIDRAFRSIKDSVMFAEWIKEQRKILVFVDDGIKLDYSRVNNTNMYDQMMGELFLFLGSFFAALEGQRFKKRALDGHSGIKYTNRWAGGQPPYGYRVIPNPTGGKLLAIDPQSAEGVKQAGKWALDGKSLWEIADMMTQAGFPTPARHVANNQGPDSRSRRKTEISDVWNQTAISKILRSPASMGLKVEGRNQGTPRLVRGLDGLPIQMAKELFSQEDWDAIQVRLEGRTRTRERSHGAAPLLGIAYCGGCQDRLYRLVNVAKGRTYSYYRCLAKPGKPRCEGYSFKESDVMTNFEQAVTIHLRDIPVMRRTFVPGEDHTAELEVVVKAMNEVRQEKDQGFYDYPGGDDEYKERIAALVSQRQILAALPQRAATWIEETTGETYTQAYFRMTPEERRTLLMGADVRFYVKPESDDDWTYALITTEEFSGKIQKTGRVIEPSGTQQEVPNPKYIVVNASDFKNNQQHRKEGSS